MHTILARQFFTPHPARPAAPLQLLAMPFGLLLAWGERLRQREALARLPERLRRDAGLPADAGSHAIVNPVCTA